MLKGAHVREVCRSTWVYSSSVWHGNLNCVYVPKHSLFLTEQLVLLFSNSNVSSPLREAY